MTEPILPPHAFWQQIHPSGSGTQDAPFTGYFPAALTGGRHLRLPIRPMADGQHALASLILNQASFTVVRALATDLAQALRPFAPEVIVGLPTLGLTLAAALAEALDHDRYVPLGTSAKFWYDDALSVPLKSITTPNQSKRLYIDPRMLALIEQRRVVIVDDVISSGASILAGLDLLDLCGITPIAIGTAMLQSDRWRQPLAGRGWIAPDKIISVMRSPMLARAPDGGWVPL